LIWRCLPLAVQQDHRAVHFRQFLAQGRIDQSAGHRGDFDWLLVEHEPRQIEIVNRHVAQEAARLGQVSARRRLRIARRDDDLVQRSDFARADRIARGLVARVEPPVEADLHGGFRPRDPFAAEGDTREVEVDRLLAERSLPKCGRGGHRHLWSDAG
jgi:hypothetical protein